MARNGRRKGCRDKKRLLKRLREARAVLKLEYRKLFKPGVFKPGERALYSDNPFGYRLQWQTRRHPDQPESYDNQQTSIGAVYLVELERPGAGHCGPNGGEVKGGGR